MIGKLTFDKSSKDMNLFLYSVYIIGKYGVNNEIRRNFDDPCFIVHMADFIGTNAYNADGREERTVYNKSLYAQYYGFIERKQYDGEEYLCLTKRGKILYSILDLDFVNKQCKIKPNYQSVFQDLIWNSIVYDSFGKNNDGAQTSKTDIDVPKVIFRVIFDLGFATNEEIFYVLFSLNRGDDGRLNIQKQYNGLIEEIITNRQNRYYDYSDFFAEKGLTNKVSDSKVIDILADPVIGIINKVEEGGIVNNYISNNCERFKQDSNLFECWNNPHNLILHSALKNAEIWLSNTILNKSRDINNSTTIILEEATQEALISELANIVNRAKANIPKVFTVVITTKSEDELANKMGSFISLLARRNDFVSTKHGFSIDPVSGIEFPSNFNFIAIITSK